MPKFPCKPGYATMHEHADCEKVPLNAGEGCQPPNQWTNIGGAPNYSYLENPVCVSGIEAIDRYSEAVKKPRPKRPLSPRAAAAAANRARVKKLDSRRRLSRKSSSRVPPRLPPRGRGPKVKRKAWGSFVALPDSDSDDSDDSDKPAKKGFFKRMGSFTKKHRSEIFWISFIAITLGLLAYENNYPTTKSAPKSLVAVMDIMFVIMMLMLLYSFRKYWKRSDTSKMSDSKKHLIWMYRLFFVGGLGFWTYYHFSLVPKARKDKRKVKKVFNFLHKISIPMIYVSLFTLQALTMN